MDSYAPSPSPSPIGLFCNIKNHSLKSDNLGYELIANFNASLILVYTAEEYLFVYVNIIVM